MFNFHEFENLKFTEDKIDPHRKYIETKGTAIVSLLFAAGAGDLENIIRLHLTGVDLGLGDYDDRTALHVAASGGHYEVVDYLLRHCNINPLKLDRSDRQNNSADQILRDNFFCKKFHYFSDGDTQRMIMRLTSNMRELQS